MVDKLRGWHDENDALIMAHNRIADIQPDRTNWKRFCKEPPLTDEEYGEWREMSEAVVANGAIFDFVAVKTEMEWKAATTYAKPGPDWSDLVEWADNNRRLARAEIRAWKEWKESVEFNPEYAAITNERLEKENES